jgi:uncharacterized protein
LIDRAIAEPLRRRHLIPMIVIGAILIIALIALVFGPSWWVQRTMRRHGAERPDFPGTGGELARHLLDKAGLTDVPVEECPPMQDHYDPIARAVRLAPENLHGRSVTAIAVAAHEVGHAVQHRDGDPFLVARTRWAGSLEHVNKIAFALLISIPLLGALVKSPALAALQLLAIIALLGARVAVHALTLPLEIDASFKRALPSLQAGGYIAAQDMAGAREVLKAAAFTYVAGALATLIDVARWLR